MDTGLIVVRANSGQRVREREISRRLYPGQTSIEGLQTKQKDHHSLWTPPVHSLLTYVLPLGKEGTILTQ
jgi:hypothetical protein